MVSQSRYYVNKNIYFLLQLKNYPYGQWDVRKKEMVPNLKDKM